ncbi:MAG: acylneuraminate cytidylyltransferase family protein [Rhodospirillales bacterium]|nr:acylneuraminate cytidylyltransferase family protein [Rhodospirillales bacterium]
MTIAIIPARGGSKRLPQKNIRLFCGTPLLAYSICAAKTAPSVDHCFVTTDAPEIAEIAEQYGADVIKRPQGLSTDSSPTASAILHALDEIARQGINTLGTLIVLQPTNPLRPVSLIEDGIKRFESCPCDSVISVNARQLKPGTVTNGYFQAQYKHGTASKDMPVTIYENGLLYVTKKETLTAYGNVSGERILALNTPTPYGDVDIDEEIDFLVGEKTYEVIKEHLGFKIQKVKP